MKREGGGVLFLSGFPGSAWPERGLLDSWGSEYLHLPSQPRSIWVPTVPIATADHAARDSRARAAQFTCGCRLGRAGRSPPRGCAPWKLTLAGAGSDAPALQPSTRPGLPGVPRQPRGRRPAHYEPAAPRAWAGLENDLG